MPLAMLSTPVSKSRLTIANSECKRNWKKSLGVEGRLFRLFDVEFVAKIQSASNVSLDEASISYIGIVHSTSKSVPPCPITCARLKDWSKDVFSYQLYFNANPQYPSSFTMHALFNHDIQAETKRGLAQSPELLRGHHNSMILYRRGYFGPTTFS